jgi:hypothetical protein
VRMPRKGAVPRNTKACSPSLKRKFWLI